MPRGNRNRKVQMPLEKAEHQMTKSPSVQKQRVMGLEQFMGLNNFNVYVGQSHKKLS